MNDRDGEAGHLALPFGDAPEHVGVRRKQAPPGGGRHLFADLGLVEGDIAGPKAPPSRLVLRPRVANEQGV